LGGGVRIDSSCGGQGPERQSSSNIFDPQSHLKRGGGGEEEFSFTSLKKEGKSTSLSRYMIPREDGKDGEVLFGKGGEGKRERPTLSISVFD